MADTDINAVLDRIEGAQDTPDAPEPTTTVPDPASAASEATAPDPGTPDPYDTGADTFDRKYVEKLRQENARYRTDSKQARDELGRYTTAFDGLDEQARDSILAIPAYLKGGPEKQAELASWLRAQADGLTVAEQQELAEQVEDAAEAKGAPLTAAAIEKMVNEKLAERDQQAAIEREGENIRKQVEDLGVTWQSEEATALLSLAASHYNADIGKAHAQMAKWAQDAIDQYVAGKAKGADTVTPTPQSAGAAVAPEKKISNLKDARDALEADLASKGMK